MGKSIKNITSFRAGELSPQLYDRDDLDYYKEAIKQGENIIIWAQGGVTKRPGTVMVTSAGEPYYEECIGTGPTLSIDIVLDDTTCQGTAVYAIDDVCQWFKYTVESSVVSGTWIEEIVLEEGSETFTWYYTPDPCVTTELRVKRVQERENLSSNVVVLAKAGCTCSGTLVVPVDHLECGESTNIYVDGVAECCQEGYVLEVETISHGSAEDGLVQTGDTTWTYTCPEGIGVGGACCIVEVATFTLYCCDGYLGEDEITLGTFEAIYWYGSNPEEMTAGQTELFSVIGGKAPYFWTVIDSDWVWEHIITTSTSNYLTAPDDPDAICGASSSLNVIDACSSNALGSIKILRECNTGDETIGYTTKQMQASQQQTLNVTDGSATCTYEWAITYGGGSLNVNEGMSVIYTSPANNPNCVSNPTITLTVCGDIVDTLTIAVNDYSPSTSIAGDYYPTWWDDTQYHTRLWQYQCGGYLYQHSSPFAHYMVYPSQFYCDYDNNLHALQYGGHAYCCQTHYDPPKTSYPSCLMARGGISALNTFIDQRSEAQKNAGCCPEQLL